MTQTTPAATPTRLVWNVGIKTNLIPNVTGATPVMATLAAYELLQPGVHTTQASASVSGATAHTVSVLTIMPDETILDPTPLRITAIALEQSLDDGLSWLPMAKVSWASDPSAAPLHPGDPLPRPGLSTSVPADGKARRFRGRLDLPQAILVGIDVTVS